MTGLREWVGFGSGSNMKKKISKEMDDEREKNASNNDMGNEDASNNDASDGDEREMREMREM